MAIGIVLGITKTFLSDDVLEFFFWVGVNLAQRWQLLGLGPLMRRIRMRLDQVAGLLGFPGLTNVIRNKRALSKASDEKLPAPVELSIEKSKKQKLT